MHGRTEPTINAERGMLPRAFFVALLCLVVWQPWQSVVVFAQARICSNSRIQISSDAPERWQQAVRSLCTELASAPDVDPAARVWIVATDTEAVVEVTLADGRSTTRHVRAPEHLFATVEALVVLPSLPPPAPVAPTPPPTAAREAPQPQPTAAPVVEPRTVLPALELGSSLVGRISRAPTYLAAGFSIYAGMRLREWLLALSVRWDAFETLVDDAPRGFEMESVGAGFLLARNLFDTGKLALQVAGTAQLLAATQSIEIAEVETTETAVDARLGLQSRLLLGVSPLRWTLGLEGELSPMRLQRPLKLYATLPSWSLGLGIGVAWEPR
jgi:hypothetical protein